METGSKEHIDKLVWNIKILEEKLADTEALLGKANIEIDALVKQYREAISRYENEKALKEMTKQELADMEKKYEERILQLHLKQIEHLKELSKPQSEGKELSEINEEYIIKKIHCKIPFSIDEDLSILDKLILDGWKVQEKRYHDAESGLKGTQLQTAYLEYYHKH